jgi:hypothetical protein
LEQIVHYHTPGGVIVMNKRLLTVVFALAFTSYAVAASFQTSATLTLKSGDKVSGQLDDLSAAGLSVLVGGDFRHFPLGDVALIDFGGGSSLSVADMDRNWNAGTHLFVMRNGTAINGELFDIGGRSPLRVTVNQGGQHRDLSSNEISQIYFVRPSTLNNNPTPAGNPPPNWPRTGERVVTVQARTQWTPTNITVTRGQVIYFDASGEIRLNREGYMVAKPAGSTENQMDRNAPLPNVPVGALIGRVGAAGGGSVFARSGGQMFVIGDRTTVEMPASGQLFLGVNDSNLNDNSGSFNVRMSPEGARSRQ